MAKTFGRETQLSSLQMTDDDNSLLGSCDLGGSVYQELLLQTAKDVNAAAKIKVAEMAWVAYRDAYIQAMYPAANKQAIYGSIFP